MSDAQQHHYPDSSAAAAHQGSAPSKSTKEGKVQFLIQNAFMGDKGSASKALSKSKQKKSLNMK